MEIKLPPPAQTGKVSVEEALARRRSVRRYSSQQLSLEQVAQILWAAQGRTRGSFRTAPSAGATYPMELLLVVGEKTVVGLEAGVYSYSPEGHRLTQKETGDKRDVLCDACLKQRFIRQAPISLVLCAIYERTCDHYGRRGERYVHMEAGHIGQNVHLQAEALGLGTVMVGAFDDEQVSRVLRLEPSLRPLYIMPVGIPG